MGLSWESNPGPPALQANTLHKEPFKQRYYLIFATSACTTTVHPQATMSQALWDWGCGWLWLGRRYIEHRTHGGPNRWRESKALEILSREIEQGTRTSEGCVRIASRRGPHYVGAWPLPPTSSVYSIRDRCISVGNRTQDLLHCRRTLYAKSRSNSVINWYSEPQLLLLQYCLCGTAFFKLLLSLPRILLTWILSSR